MVKNNYTLEAKPIANFTFIFHETLYSPELSFGAKGLWCYINSKPLGWQFSSQRIADETKEGIKAIRTLLNELITAKLLVAHKHADGHITYELKNTKAKEPKSHKGLLGSISKKEIDISKDISMDKGHVEKSEKEDKSNPDINELFTYWEEKRGYKVKSNAAKNRMACYNLLRRKDIGKDRLKMIIDDLATGNQYPPECADFCELQLKWNKIEAWQLRLKPRKTTAKEYLEKKYRTVKADDSSFKDKETIDKAQFNEARARLFGVSNKKE